MTLRTRAPVIVAAIGVAAAADYWFVRRPEPHSVAEFNPIRARLGREELILAKPVLAGDSLFSHQGGKNEVVEMFFEQGVFAPVTKQLLHGQSWAQSEEPQAISYTTLDADGAHGPPCRTFVEIKPVGNGLSEVHLFQDGIAGGENHRDFSVRAVGARLQVNFITDADNPAQVDQPGCRKLLQAGENQIKLTGMIPVSVVAAAGSAVRLKFMPASSAPLWEGNRGLFEPFAALALRAASARLSPIDSQQSLFFASAPAGQTGLSMEGFLAGSDRIEMQLSGVGWVWVNGHPVSPTFSEWLSASSLRAGMVAFLNLAMLCGLAVFAAGSTKTGQVLRWVTGRPLLDIPDPARGLVVFLCHCSEDKETVRTISRRSKAAGFQPWLDEEAILPARIWDKEIQRGLRSSQAVVVCLSPIFKRKEGFVQKELRYALDLALEKPEGDTFLIPVRLEECEIPDSLEKLQYIDWFKPGGDERLLGVLQERARQV